MIISNEFMRRLKELASKHVWSDDLQSGDTVIDDFAGGNVDDAYYGGERAGTTRLARLILTELGVEFTIEE